MDVTIADLDMGTDFDDFTPRGLAYATDGISAKEQATVGCCGLRWKPAA